MECLFLLEGNNLIILEPEDWIKIERKLTSIGLFCYKYIFTIYTKDIFTVLFCLVIKEYCFCKFQTILCIILPLNVSFRWKFFSVIPLYGWFWVTSDLGHLVKFLLIWYCHGLTGELSGEEMVMRSFTQAFFRAQMWDNHIDDENNLNAAAIYRYLKLIVRYSGNWGLNIDDTEKVNHSRPSTSFLPPFLLFFWAGGWGFEGWKGRHSLDFQQNYEYVRSVIEKMTSFICRVMYEFYFLSFFFLKNWLATYDLW